MIRVGVEIGQIRHSVEPDGCAELRLVDDEHGGVPPGRRSACPLVPKWFRVPLLPQRAKHYCLIQSLRAGRLRKALAALSSGNDSLVGSHFNLRPSSMAMLPRCIAVLSR